MYRLNYDRSSVYLGSSVRLGRTHFDVNIPRSDKMYYVGKSEIEVNVTKMDL